jgi:hypothetical protein
MRDIRWAAGLFEGEGCAEVRKDGGGRLRLTMTDQDAVLEFHRVMGRGAIRQMKVPRGNKPAWDWYVSHKDDVRFCAERLLPYMCERRRKAINAALSAAASRRTYTRKRQPGEAARRAA